MKKEECLIFLKSKQVKVPNNWTAVELKKMVKDYIKAKIPLECKRLAKEQGHELLLTPPYHSNLQPIKLVWVLVKGTVGRQYDNKTTLELVHERLKAEFDNLLTSGHNSVAGMINKCAETLLKFFQEMEEGNVNVEDDDDTSVDDNKAEEENSDAAQESEPEYVEESWTQMEKVSRL